MFKASISGDFVSKIAARRDAWRARKIGALIYAPDALKWWIYQEYGTATRGQFGGPRYPIDPVNAKVLAFPNGQGGTTLTPHVDHPGIPPRHSVEKALPQIEEFVMAALEQALNEGAADDPIALQEAVIKAVTEAKQLIVRSMSENIPGTRDDGRLQGQSAAGAFESESEVRPLTQGE